MNIYRGLPDGIAPNGCELTIGNFDGVHKGHQALIEQLVAAAQETGRTAGALTFTPHPLQVLRPHTPLAYLTTLDERLTLLESLGLDFVVIYSFTKDTARMTAAAFMQALVDHLGLRRLWVGPDFALGRNREGNIERLRQLGAGMGFTVEVIQPIQIAGREVRSGHIRRILADGNVDLARQMLGRPYWLEGKVIRGAGRGRSIGLPTANLEVPPERLIPAHGVYATWCHVDGRRLPAATNIGVRPTFDNGHPTVEAHILDFQGDLYEATVRLEFVLRLRPERRFAHVDDLIAQVQQDIANTRRALAPEPPRFEEIEHTADWSIRIFGRDFADLLSQAGAAMYAMEEVDMAADPHVWREVEVEAPDREGLLVTWLSELLYQSETTGESYTRFVIDEATETRIKARIGGIPGYGERAHIKAVTYHNLSVRKTPDGWEATVVFDT